MFDPLIYCPTIKCTYKRKLKKDEKCPECGSESKLFGLTESVELFNQKDGRKPDGTRILEEGGGEEGHRVEFRGSESSLLFSDTTTETEIKSQIYRDMGNLARQESGTGAFNALNILTGTNAEVLIGKALKAMIDQNKILIRQNELILRELRKGNKTQELAK